MLFSKLIFSIDITASFSIASIFLFITSEAICFPSCNDTTCFAIISSSFISTSAGYVYFPINNIII